MGSCTGCQLDVLGGRGRGATSRDVRGEPIRPSVGRKPRHKHLDRKPGRWPAERALVSPASEALAQGGGRQPGAAAALTRLAGGSPLGWGRGFKGVSGKASRSLAPKRCFLEEGQRSREHGVWSAGPAG